MAAHKKTARCRAAAQANENARAATQRGLVKASNSVAYLAETIGIKVERIFDQHHARRQVKLTSSPYVPGWFRALAHPLYEEACEHWTTARFHEVLEPIVVDLEYRASLEALNALGGPRAIMEAAEKRWKERKDHEQSSQVPALQRRG